MGTWLLATSVVVAPIRLATNRSMSGWTVRSFLATMYQLGFDFQAVPATFALNRSASGTHWVAQTSFFSCSDKSPAKQSMPSGQPDTSVRDFDVGKDVRLREVKLLCLRCLVGVE